MRFLRHSLLPALLSAAVFPRAAAQTARIAHFSHSGSEETLAEAGTLDNFGIIPPYFEVDSVQLLSDTTALEYGRWNYMHREQENLREQKTNLVTYPKRYGWGQKKQLALHYQENSPKMKVLGFDSVAAPAIPAPALKTQKAKRKKAAFLLTVPAPPHPGVWVGVAAILLFAGAGWLLGERAELAA
ncbi:hypothetical protein Q5H93_22320 [Hymenobacter sp. ASUV-10]|uniref:Uncharacterized protein n=1 Tax=Hymenobacter aranciens TaxID=3063996 RepID=A0ABT9BGT8_9BACT|nr:hypothetical protein [Hymenobacter sp. ASUV-10]MDO7877491.1 hypothetical protein [Hymenobacter sp. ASUV-10]